MPVFLKKNGVYRPTVLDTFIDKISITCDVPVAQQYEIIQGLKNEQKGPKYIYGISAALPLGTKFLESDGDKNTDTIPRLDVAVDVANLAIDDYVFHRPGIRYTRIECQSGKTMYLGSDERE